ncbi:MAG TPA: NAD(P)/FAD-dependent oxidoreductase, partial [Acidimicrobiales bacterium]|nr:NAD(P)/FAD-dependent oxidoreductase [Acidimicrobiales bacterium]
MALAALAAIEVGAPDAVVVGSGPNGLAAAVVLARAGLSVEVHERAETPGGGCRSADLTLPGFVHDVCSAVHPLLAVSPFFASVDLEKAGVRLCQPPVAFAHPLPHGRAAVVRRSVADTAEGLGVDAARYRRLFEPLVDHGQAILSPMLAPLRGVPSHPLAVARFAVPGLLPMSVLARRFRTEEAKALLAGAAAHSMRPMEAPLTASFAVFFTLLAHLAGWPVVEGGSGRVVDALLEMLDRAGATVTCGNQVRALSDLPPARASMLDVSPNQLPELVPHLPSAYGRQLQRFRYGPGVCKVDWALDGPVPWTAEACRQAGTLHVCGTYEEVAASEREVNAGRHPQRPYCIVVQAVVADPSRAPQGKHTLWAYCHVPPGSTMDMTERIEAQIERFAPGFADLVLARRVTTAAEIERYDPNYVGGDVNGGAATLRQMLVRPAMAWNPYRVPVPGVYLCSASTPPGGGV